jgi:hypothetical protein
MAFEIELPASAPGFPAQARPSFASLFVELASAGDVIGLGTAFVSLRGDLPFLITNRHLVRGRDNFTDAVLDPRGRVPDTIVVHHSLASGTTGWTPRAEKLLQADGSPNWLEHPTLDGQVDVVALPLTDVAGVLLRPHDPVSPGRPIPYDVGGDVSIIGYPFGLGGGQRAATWTKGFVASEPSLDHDGLPLFLVDARTRPGSSGSPVLVYRHQGAVMFDDHRLRQLAYPVEYFVGVYSGRVHVESDLGIVWKNSAVAALLRSVPS